MNGWEVDQVDVAAYLERIGYGDAPHVDVATLAGLHRRHRETIPFENIDVQLGRTVRVDLASVVEKLVGRRRGGYCYEQATLFGAVLERLGFGVTRLLARVGAGQYDDTGEVVRAAPRTHMALRVEVDGAAWLADVGFGSGLLDPVPLVADVEAVQGGWSYRLRGGPDGWELQEIREGTWVTLYLLPADPQYPVDAVMSNHFTSTWPDSPFVRRLVAIGKDDAALRVLTGRTLTTSRAGRPPAAEDLDDDAVTAFLTDIAVELPPDDLTQLLGTLPHA